MESKNFLKTDLLSTLSQNPVDIEYMYGLSIDGDSASVVVKTSDLNKASKILIDNGAKALTKEDISKF